MLLFLVSHHLKDAAQVVPAFVDSRDVHRLLRSVHVAQCRAERNHVKLRIVEQEVSTLKSGMERSAERSDSIKILISLHSHLEDFRIHVRSPSWISVALLHTRATKIEVRVNLTGDVVFAALLLAALRSGDRNHMLVAVHADKRRVGRSVDPYPLFCGS